MVLRSFIVISVLLLLRYGNAQHIEKDQLLGVWYHAVEEQTDDSISIFRPEGYELPRARGREKMMFNPDNSYIYYQIAPADGYLELKGDFKLDKENNELDISYIKDQKKHKKKYKIVQLNTDILRLKLIDTFRNK
ncbi:hypothetical protein LS482_17240 [Sinomicrobium kalidii]|uniref:hypothetical protein n=1 Tax=Sinomicrobium kalidii TaxID=2900738 RepID=UPI001E38A976|nr:hypothetical protein [Sinomicrobium kalidii]UGU15414.1 hypothetical protein LS482_17240 [Sinomicrobium kalidii]